jgi:hypothetical protein
MVNLSTSTRSYLNWHLYILIILIYLITVTLRGSVALNMSRYYSLIKIYIFYIFEFVFFTF